MEGNNDDRSRRDETGNHRLREMKKRRDALNARIMRETNKVRSAEHRKDTRRKILMGAWAYEQATKDSEFSRMVMAALEHFLVRENDRALFGLPSLKKSESQSQ
ncbi:MAG TPA: hypothetical protein VHZ07_20885 [Bryobacteraceae bacterium]|jgi:hypothetical protein|nr:hypothetical protein [Bryobacteraceae bacterium]